MTPVAPRFSRPAGEPPLHLRPEGLSSVARIDIGLARRRPGRGRLRRLGLGPGRARLPGFSSPAPIRRHALPALAPPPAPPPRPPPPAAASAATAPRRAPADPPL